MAKKYKKIVQHIKKGRVMKWKREVAVRDTLEITPCCYSWNRIGSIQHRRTEQQ